MLSIDQMNAIKQSAPLLKGEGTNLVTVFYQNMIRQHPELLNQFNQTNLMNGSQPEALAATLYQAALHIDRLEELLPAVKQIAHKHVSVMVKKEQYPIVGYYLIEAMKEVFGLTEKDDTLLAWKAAYDIIANIFITIEGEMMEVNVKQPGGWADVKPFVIKKKVQESPALISFYLVPEDESELPMFEAGQYITVQADMPGEAYMCSRQYSLSDHHHPSYYRITVKRDGHVSTFLHDEMEEGDVLQVSMPQGMFCLQEATKEPVYFISAGSGVTPMIGLLKTAAQNSHPFTMIHADRLEDVTAFENEFESVLASAPHGRIMLCNEQFAKSGKGELVEKAASRIDRLFLQSVVGEGKGQFYLCGSPVFTQEMIYILKELGIPEQNIHFESFGGQSTKEMEVV
ncbi:globin domain-containing protein [Bacillus pumilus]|uniref:globin domain-containing protein n=1 Tax=Bacillus TaxID=1386 RepID=UPI0006811ED4|nr:globin domain-containing protein [Bacillus pumilus]KMY20275.1 nitric oxide dioxygenase [Bacillus pumilus]MCI4617466.1 FAD-binding oxidoreductase [Bacillus pumilus]